MNPAPADERPSCTEELLIPEAPSLAEAAEKPALGPIVDAQEAAESQCLYVPVAVETDINSEADGWAAFTKHIEKLCEVMEKCVWPIDPDADVAPHTLMPFVYGSPTGEECEDTLRSLLAALTLGLQGQAFQWRYKFDFDVIWSDERKGYLVLLNSVRRMWNRGLSETKPETIELAPAVDSSKTAESTDFKATE